MSATENVNKVLRQIIPRGQRFRVTWEPAGFSKYRVLRVVTPAWKTQPRFERILKVQKAIDAHLPPKVLDRILRVSVLTADEYRRWLGIVGPRRPHRVVRRRRSVNGK